MTRAMPRRILMIWLARLAIDRWRRELGCLEGEGADAGPFALIEETSHGSRIRAVNAVARGTGLEPGMILTDARTLCRNLATALSDPVGDSDCLERLALRARRWGPWSTIDSPDGIFVDITGVAHLFDGEEALLADVRKVFARWGFTARMAIAPTAGAAWALAHHGPSSSILPLGENITDRLCELPVAGLRLDQDTLLVLRRLGLKRLGDLYGIGRNALKRRFRNSGLPIVDPLLRLDQLLGRLPEPLLPVVPVTLPAVQRRLLEPLFHREQLVKVVEDLAGDMAGLLEMQAQGARRLELSLYRVDGDIVCRMVKLASARRDPSHFHRLFGARLDDVDAGFGIEMVRLCAIWVEPLVSAQSRLGRASGRAGTSLAACLDRLTVRLGEQAVRSPAPHASHIPERAQRWQAPLDRKPAGQGNAGHQKRPLKMLDQAEPIAVLYASPDGLPRRFRWRGRLHEVVKAEGPERIAPEWWRERSHARLRDYYRIEDGQGRRYWIYRLGLADDGRGGVPEWFLQGLWA